MIVGSRRHAGKVASTTVSSKRSVRHAPVDWMTADEKMCERLPSVRAALPILQPRPENAPTQPRMATGRRAGPRFVQDESNARPVPRGATRVETHPVPSNWLRRDTRPVPVLQRTNTKFQPRHRNARDRLADKLHAAPPTARAAASEWQR